MPNKPSKPYRTKGKFKRLLESDRRVVFNRAKPDSNILSDVDMLANYLQNFGIVSAREVIMMLTVWMCDPKNKEESRKYWKRLGDGNEKNIHDD